MNYSNPTNPGVLFGGTWEAITYRYLVGVGPITPNSNNAVGSVDAYAQAGYRVSPGESFGEIFHQLTVSEMPSHRHGMTGNNGGGGNNCYPFPITNGGVNWNSWNPTDAAGGDQAHNNLPPSLAVYMWRRTA